MTREQEIVQKAYEISQRYFPDSENIWARPNIEAQFVQSACCEIVKWADENPNKKLVYTKKELLDMGFAFDLNGNISTPQEIEEKTKKYINYQKDKWIKKACEWFIGEFSQMQDRDGHPNVESRSCVSVEELIQDFRKVMEG